MVKRPSALCIFLYVLSDSRWEQFRNVRVNLFVKTRAPLLDHSLIDSVISNRSLIDSVVSRSDPHNQPFLFPRTEICFQSRKAKSPPNV